MRVHVILVFVYCCSKITRYLLDMAGHTWHTCIRVWLILLQANIILLVCGRQPSGPESNPKCGPGFAHSSEASRSPCQACVPGVSYSDGEDNLFCFYSSICACEFLRTRSPSNTTHNTVCSHECLPGFANNTYGFCEENSMGDLIQASQQCRIGSYVLEGSGSGILTTTSRPYTTKKTSSHFYNDPYNDYSSRNHNHSDICSPGKVSEQFSNGACCSGCTVCPPGYRVAASKNEGRRKCVTCCARCMSGTTHSVQENSDHCQVNTVCACEHRYTLWPGNATHDTLCEHCLQGYTETPDGCQKLDDITSHNVTSPVDYCTRHTVLRLRELDPVHKRTSPKTSFYICITVGVVGGLLTLTIVVLCFLRKRRIIRGKDYMLSDSEDTRTLIVSEVEYNMEASRQPEENMPIERTTQHKANPFNDHEEAVENTSSATPRSSTQPGIATSSFFSPQHNLVSDVTEDESPLHGLDAAYELLDKIQYFLMDIADILMFSIAMDSQKVLVRCKMGTLSDIKLKIENKIQELNLPASLRHAYSVIEIASVPQVTMFVKKVLDTSRSDVAQAVLEHSVTFTLSPGNPVYVTSNISQSIPDPKHRFGTITCILTDFLDNRYGCTAYHAVQRMCLQECNSSFWVQDDNGTSFKLGDGLVKAGLNPQGRGHSDGQQAEPTPEQLFEGDADLFLFNLNGENIKSIDLDPVMTYEGAPKTRQMSYIADFFENKQQGRKTLVREVQMVGAKNRYQTGFIQEDKVYVRGGFLPRNGIIVQIKAGPGDSGAMITTRAKHDPSQPNKPQPCYAISSVMGELSYKTAEAEASAETEAALPDTGTEKAETGGAKAKSKDSQTSPSNMLTYPVKDAIAFFGRKDERQLYFLQP